MNLDLENYLQSYDVILGLQIFYDPISCGTNIARGTNHKLLNGGVDLGLERWWYRLDTRWIMKYGKNLYMDILVLGLTIGFT